MASPPPALNHMLNSAPRRYGILRAMTHGLLWIYTQFENDIGIKKMGEERENEKGETDKGKLSGETIKEQESKWEHIRQSAVKKKVICYKSVWCSVRGDSSSCQWKLANIDTINADHRLHCCFIFFTSCWAKFQPKPHRLKHVLAQTLVIHCQAQVKKTKSHWIIW